MKLLRVIRKVLGYTLDLFVLGILIILVLMALFLLPLARSTVWTTLGF